MFSSLLKSVQDNPDTVKAVLVAISAFATVVTIFLPKLRSSVLKTRMKSVAIERDQLRAKDRTRIATESMSRHKAASQGTLRMAQRQGVRQFVEKLDLQRALADDKTLASLRTAGFRGQNALNLFLAARFGLPFITLSLTAFWIFGLDGLAQQSTMVRILICLVGGYIGFYAPNLYVSNVGSKRKQSIQLAWPDSLDLMLICVESGMSIEAAFKKVSEEIGLQSTALAEEFVLTNAELSFLPERRQAYENLATRTGLETVKSVVQALTQSERYGTSIGAALRTLSDESREMRLNAAEKKLRHCRRNSPCQ